MKKLSLFGLLGLTGFLAFFTTPIYAQEDEVAVDDVVAEAENIVDETENIVDEVENTVGEVENTVDEVEDFVEDDVVEDSEVVISDEVDEWLDDEILSEDEIWTGVSLEEIQNELEAWAESLWMTKEEATVFVSFLIGFGLGGLVVIAVVFIILLILGVIALWMAFKRAWESGWKAIIPIYNTYIMYKLAGVKNWFWYSLIISIVLSVAAYYLPDYSDTITYVSQCVCWIITFVAIFLFARKYGWGVMTSILFVILNPICMSFLGFGNYPYEWKS